MILLFYISYLLYIPKCISIKYNLYLRKRSWPVFKKYIFWVLTCILNLSCSKNRQFFFKNLYSRLRYFVGYFLSFFVFFNCYSLLSFQNLILALYQCLSKDRLYLLRCSMKLLHWKKINEEMHSLIKVHKCRLYCVSVC